MNYLDKRRSKQRPDAINAASDEARRQVALAVSLAKRKTQAEVLEAVASILSKRDDA